MSNYKNLQVMSSKLNNLAKSLQYLFYVRKIVFPGTQAAVWSKALLNAALAGITWTQPREFE